VLLGVIYFFLFVVLVACGGAGYFLLNPPSDLIRQKIVEQVKEKTGRDLVIAGPVHFTLFPILGVSLEKVSLSNPPGMDGSLVKMQALDVSLEAQSLIWQPVKINSIVLRKPTFDFQVDKSGHNNWEFAEGNAYRRYAELQTPGTRSDVEPVATDPTAQTPSHSHSKRHRTANLELKSVRIEDGKISFTDERTGKARNFSDINVKVRLGALQNPLKGRGNFVWRGQRVNFDGKLSNVEGVLRHKPGHLSFNTSNALITASYDGGVLLGDEAYLEGAVTTKVDSTRALADWFGTELPPVSGFGPLSIRGTLKTSGNVTDFSNAVFELDGQTAKGEIKVTTGGVRPHVEANLNIAELDLNKYLTSAVTGITATEGTAQEQGERSATPALKPGIADGPAPKPKPDQIEKLLNATPGTKVYGARQRAGWSSKQMNMALLAIADGDARVRIGKLHFKKMTIGQSSVAVAMQDKAMRATFNDVQLYQGHGKGTVTIDGTTDTAANVAANFDLEDISAGPFLRDAADFGWIAGKTNVSLQLTANGASQLQLVESLNGTAGFYFSDGAIVGFNLPGAVRGISRGDFSKLKAAPSEKTDFSELKATFQIKDGVAQNSDLQLVSPLLRVSGAGTVRLPERTLDYTVKPKLVASLEGQEGEKGLSGIEVPVRITGSWDKPEYQADLKGILANPDKTVEAIKKIGKKFKGKDANEIVDQVFGKSDDGGSDASTERTKKKAKKWLNKLLGKQGDDE
jgi:AsmA protein